MVIGDRFAWAHLPKTGGDTTAAMFAAVPGLVRFADPLDSDDKHLPFFAREAQVDGKLLAMGFRRLPAWLLSGAHHRARYGLAPDYAALPLESNDEIAAKTDPDDLLRWMTDHGRFRVDRWLRTESLLDDVLGLLGDLQVLTPAAGRSVRAVGVRNAGSYEPTAFTDTQLQTMYDRNPTWATIERTLYR